MAQAERLYKAILRTQPAHVGALTNCGVALLALKQPEEALASHDRVLALQPDSFMALSNRGNALRELKRPDEALASFDRALALQPDSAMVLSNRGNALLDLKRPDVALASYDRALELQPNYADALSNRGNALLALKRPDDALASFDRALALQPDHVEALSNRGLALKDLKRCEDALVSYDRALALKPDFAEALSNRGTLLMEMGEQKAAIESLRAAIKSNPARISSRFTHLIAHIPAIARHEGDIEQSRTAFARELALLDEWLAANNIDNEADAVGSAQPFYLAYQEKNNRDLLGRYGKLCSRLMAGWQRKNGIPLHPQWEARRVDGAQRNPPIQIAVDSGRNSPLSIRPTVAERERFMSRGGGKIKLGIVSARILDDSVFNAIVRGWFEHLDKDRFEIDTFCLGAAQDNETALAKANSSHFESGIKGIRDWANSIAGRNIDILIYPEIGMDAVTVQLASTRLAPLQLATWGHPETSGLPTIDYYLSAEAFETAGSRDCYTERLLQLPNLGCYYDPGNVVAAKTDLGKLGIRGTRPMFVCPGMPFKYAPQHDHVFVEIARELKTCQFVFFTFDKVPALSQKLFSRLSLAFKAADLDCSKHVVFVPWLEKPDFHGVMRQADVFLDTIGFSGFNTAMQAVECNLPIVTREGRFMRGRFGSAIMKRLGIAELVADDDAAYIECAIRLARDRPFRDGIRKKMQGSGKLLFRDLASIRGLETVLIELMQQKTPPQRGQ